MKNHFKLIPLEERIVLDGAAATVIYVNVNTPANPAHQTGADWAHAWSNLQSALTEAAAHPGDQIWVAKGTYYPTTTGDPTATFNIPNQTSIYGGFNGTETQLSQSNPIKNPTILSGNLLGNNTDNTDTIVTIGTTPNEKVSLDGLTITGADNTLTGGGGLVATNGSNVTLTDMTFSNDIATGEGGAIFASGANSINIIDSQFLHDSSASDGGAVLVTSAATLNIIGSDFNDNTTSMAAGAADVTGVTNTTITSSSFENNTAVINGGALLFIRDTNMTVTQSTFNNNSVPSSPSSFWGGGAISSFNDQHDTFTYNTFTYNSDLTPSGFGGGAIYSNSSVNTLISHNIFDHNNAVDEINHGNVGAAINLDNGGTINITYNSFTNNTADYGAAIGAIPFVANLNIAYNSFSNNVAAAGDGGAILTGLNNTVSINHNLFVNNSAGFGGGALDLGIPGIPDSTVSVTNNIFINNTSPLGGAIISNEPNLSISNDVFINNSATNGGAIADMSTVTLSITNDVFLANSATQGGNSIWLDGMEGTVNGVNPQLNPSQVISALVNSNIALFSEDILIA